MKMKGGSGIGAESLASPKIEVLCRANNMFSTYGKLHPNFLTIPTSKNTESVLNRFETCSEPVGNLLGTGWQDLSQL